MSLFSKAVNVIQNIRGRGYPQINAAQCVGCGTRKKNCRHAAIPGQPKEAHFIDAQKCFRCYHCMENCPKGAIVVSRPEKAKQ